MRFDLTEVNDKRKNIAFLSECFRAKSREGFPSRLHHYELFDFSAIIFRIDFCEICATIAATKRQNLESLFSFNDDAEVIDRKE